MLSQFSVKNFRSFRDRMTFDMQATAISEHTDKIIAGKDGLGYLPIGAIYGTNGGGKTTVLDAINSLVSKVLRPIYAVKPQKNMSLLYKNKIEPFKFSAEMINEPTEYEMYFSTEEAEYRYFLNVKGDDVLYESLDRIKFSTRRKSVLFIRDNENISLKGDFSGLKINEDISLEIPLISYFAITYYNHPIVRDVTNWFLEGICFASYDQLSQFTELFIPDNPKFKKIILDMVREMDIDVVDYKTKEKTDKSFEVITVHEVDDELYQLKMEEESGGTIKIFELLPRIAYSIVQGQTLIVDELDSKLHPLLLKYLIELYSDMSINRKGAQLIYTSHDMATMNSELFRRDEIWFTAKGRQQNSVLYSLVEFKDDRGKTIRKDARFDKQYLEHRYGADPYVKRFIEWGDVNA